MRTQLKSGKLGVNHNEGIRVRSALKAGNLATNHNDMLRVRSALKAAGQSLNHNDALRVRSTVKAGKLGDKPQRHAARSDDSQGRRAEPQSQRRAAGAVNAQGR